MKNEFTGCVVWDHNDYLWSCTWHSAYMDYQLLYKQKNSAKTFEFFEQQPRGHKGDPSDEN